MRSICRNVCPCLWYKIRFIHIFVVCCFNFMIKPDSSVAYGIHFILFLCSDKVTFYWAIKGIAQRGRRNKCQSLENARNKPFSDSRHWTGTSLQLRLWYENDIPRKSLHCKLVPVPCREHEYGLFTYRVVTLLSWTFLTRSAECGVNTGKTSALGNSHTTENLGKDIGSVERPADTNSIWVWFCFLSETIKLKATSSNSVYN